jgi:hypothetical protein
MVKFFLHGCLKLDLCTCFKDNIDSLNAYQTLFQYLMYLLNVFVLSFVQGIKRLEQ